MPLFKRCLGMGVKVVKIENIVFLKHKLRFLAQQKTRNGVFRPPPGPQLALLGIQIDPRVSADAVDESNGLHQSARPQADVDKKTEFSLLKNRSEILVPLILGVFSRVYANEKTSCSLSLSIKVS